MCNVIQKLDSIIDKTNKKEAAQLLRKLCFNITNRDFQIIKMHISNGLENALKTGCDLNNEYYTFREKKYMDILSLFEICYYLRLENLNGFENKIEQFDSFDYTKVNSILYEFQIAWTLKKFGCDVTFIEEGNKKSPDLLVSFNGDSCEIECKNKVIVKDREKYPKSIYESIQTARKQFSKERPAIIMIEVDSRFFDSCLQDSEVMSALSEQITKSFRTSETISAIRLSVKKLQDGFDYLEYSYDGLIFKNPEASLKVPDWFSEVFRTKESEI